MSNLDNASVDGLIRQRLPSWLRNAPLEHLAALRRGMRTSQAAQEHLQELLQKVQPLDTFAERLLSDEFARHFGQRVNVRDFRLRRVRRVLDSIPSASVPTRFVTKTTYQSLLHAALHNFDAAEANPGGQDAATAIINAQGAVQSFSVTDFVKLCRRLDVGRSYQQHLKSILIPPSGPSPSHSQASQFQVALEQAMIRNFCVELWIARAKDKLNSTLYAGLLHAFEPPVQVPLDTQTFVPHSLRLLGKPMNGIVAFEVRERLFNPERLSEVRQVVLYVPNDPVQPIGTYSSWPALYTELAVRLSEKHYPPFFQRFVREHDRGAFTHILQRLLANAKEGSSIELDGRHTSVPVRLFSTLAQAQVEKILDDARVLAVPTDDEDRLARANRLQTYEDAGLTLANLAAFFVPGLGEVMLGVAVAQMLGEVYHGYEDWQLGDREGALEHLYGVAENLAANALLAAGGTAVVRAIRRSTFVDNLVPIQHEDGQWRLWNPNLALYQSAEEDAASLISGQHAGRFDVEQNQRTGQWHIRSPAATIEYSPRLEPVGNQGWRLSWDHPQHWQGSTQMLQRFGGDWQRLSETQLRQVLAITGIEEAQLRQWHINNAPVPATVVDTLTRLKADHHLNTLLSGLGVGNVGEPSPVAIKALTQLDSWPDNLALSVSIPGEGRVATFGSTAARQTRSLELMNAASAGRDWLDQVLISLDGDTKQLLLAGTNASLTERQRLIGRLSDQLKHSRQSSFEYLYEQTNSNASDNAQLLRRSFPGLPVVVAEEIIRHAKPAELQRMTGTLKIPLPLAEEARYLLREIRVNRALEGFYLENPNPAETTKLVKGFAKNLPGWPIDHVPEGIAQHSSSEYFQEVVDALPSPQSHDLALNAGSAAHDLRNRFASLASGQREETSRLIGINAEDGWFHPPQRLRDGRVGYPLSGRQTGGRRAVNAAVRELFPTFTDAQIDEFLIELRVNGQELWSGLQALTQELATLNETLYTWQAEDAVRGASRERVAMRLRRCWRRQTARVRNRGADYRLLLEHESIGELPNFPESISFPHVAEVTLSDLGLSAVPTSFLQRFPALRWLDVVRNQLTSIPVGVASLPQLTWLNLSHNQIRWTTQDNRLLASVRNLEVLDLDHNPLGTQLDVSQLPRLRILRLRNTQIVGVPAGLLSRSALQSADLRDNPIVVLHEGLFNAPRHILQRINFHDNPLNAESRARLLEFERAALLPAMAGYSHASFSNLMERWLADVPPEQQTLRHQQWESLRAEPGAEDLFRLLGDLRDTSDYARHRKDLSRRVWEVLEGCYRSTALRDELFALARTPRSCSDNAALTFSQLEIRAYVVAATANASGAQRERSLLELARGLFRLDEVDRLSTLEIQQRRADGESLDEVEVALAYRTGLATELNLPGQPRTMQYGWAAGVSRSSLARMSQQIRRAQNTPRLASSIAAREFWIDFLRQDYHGDFETMNQPFHDQIEALELVKADLKDSDYLEQVDTITKARDLAENALIETLTLRALRHDAASADQEPRPGPSHRP